eukprot:s1515_g2.t1
MPHQWFRKESRQHAQARLEAVCGRGLPTPLRLNVEDWQRQCSQVKDAPIEDWHSRSCGLGDSQVLGIPGNAALPSRAKPPPPDELWWPPGSHGPGGMDAQPSRSLGLPRPPRRVSADQQERPSSMRVEDFTDCSGERTARQALRPERVQPRRHQCSRQR